MTYKIEFGDAKQLRKTLLITSFIGISFKSLFQNSTGDFEFFGFIIPVADASIIPNLIGFLIIYLLIALVIRYRDEEFRKRYKKAKEYSKNIYNEPSDKQLQQYQEMEKLLKDSNFKKSLRKFGIYFLDIYFPLALGVFALFKIFINFKLS